MATIHDEIKTFIVDTFLFGSGGDTLDLETSLLDQGIIDSTGVLELVGFLESTYAISVEDEELIPENLDSIASIASFVERKQKSL